MSGGRYADGAAGHVCYVGQLFFPQAYNDEVRATSPYTANTIPYVVNAKDYYFPHIEGDKPVFSVSKDGAGGYRAAMTLVVDPTSTPSSGAADAGAKDAAPDAADDAADERRRWRGRRRRRGRRVAYRAWPARPEDTGDREPRAGPTRASFSSTIMSATRYVGVPVFRLRSAISWIVS